MSQYSLCFFRRSYGNRHELWKVFGRCGGHVGLPFPRLYISNEVCVYPLKDARMFQLTLSVYHLTIPHFYNAPSTVQCRMSLVCPNGVSCSVSRPAHDARTVLPLCCPQTYQDYS